MALTTTSAVRELSDNNPSGTRLGQTTTDLISFSGATPVAQPASANQQAINAPINGLLNQTGGAGALTHYVSTQTPSSVAANSVAEQSFTVTGVLATDLIIINKPTTDVGLGLCSSRASAANTIQVAFLNTTAGVLTPAATEGYRVTTFPANLQLSATLSPAAVAASTTVEQLFTVTGVAPGMIVQVNKPTTNAGVAVLTSRVTANNQIGITFANTTAGVLTPTAAEVYVIGAYNALVAASNLIECSVVATITGRTSQSTSEQIVTAAGINATDVVVGAQKPALTAGLGLVGARVSAANSLGFSFANVTAGVLTPAASEVYGVTLFRPSPAAPMWLSTTATLSPTSVAANSTAEQTFTVTGIVSGQPVVAIPNFNIAAQGGLGVVGCRASATNTLAISFCNLTAGTLTPAAGTWQVAHFNMVAPTAGNYVQSLVSPLQTVGASLTNGMRSALVTVGLIAGA